MWAGRGVVVLALACLILEPSFAGVAAASAANPDATVAQETRKGVPLGHGARLEWWKTSPLSIAMGTLSTLANSSVVNAFGDAMGRAIDNSPQLRSELSAIFSTPPLEQNAKPNYIDRSLPEAQSFLETSSNETSSSTITTVSPCTFVVYENRTLNTLATSAITSATTVTECAQACADLHTCQAYSWGTSCHLVTDSSVMNAFLYNSAVCVSRGGCDGMSGSQVCSWKGLLDTDLRSIYTTSTAAMPTVAVESENACRIMCEEYDDEQCLGYTWTKSTSGTSNCALFGNVTNELDGAESGVCQRGLSFQTEPGDCWINEACSQSPVVRVPSELGQPLVTLILSEIINGRSESESNVSMVNATVRCVNGVANFTGFGMDRYGRYKISAVADGADCPTNSSGFTVDDLSQHTLFRWNSHFPTSDGFVLVRLKHNCTTVIFMLTITTLLAAIALYKLIMSVLDLITLQFKSVIKSVLFSLIVLVLFRDFQNAWTTWDCGDEFLENLLDVIPFYTTLSTLG